MKVEHELVVIRDLLAQLVKVEAMRAANDGRAVMASPPKYSIKDFDNCIDYVHHVEDKITSGELAKKLEGNGHLHVAKGKES